MIPITTALKTATLRSQRTKIRIRIRPVETLRVRIIVGRKSIYYIQCQIASVTSINPVTTVDASAHL